MRAIEFSILICLEDVVDTRLESVWPEKESVPSDRVNVRLSEGVLIFPDDFDVGSHKHLEAWAEAVPRLMLRERVAVNEIGMGIHRIIVKGAD